MGVFVPLPAGAQVQILHALGGVLIQNRLWFVKDNLPITQADLDGLNAGVASWWNGDVLPLLSDEFFTIAFLAEVWDTTPPGINSIINQALPGGSASPSHSANVAVVVPFLWPLGIREKRNKHYVAGVPDDAIVLNTVQPVFNDALFEAYVGLIDKTRDFTPRLNWRWVVTSAYDNNAPRTEQLWYSCQGVPQNTTFKVGQRRKRLPGS